MVKRFVKVVATGYFEIYEDTLKESYSAGTFEEAVDNQRRWHEDDPNMPLQDYVDSEVDMTFELMPEGFDPELTAKD